MPINPIFEKFQPVTVLSWHGARQRCGVRCSAVRAPQLPKEAGGDGEGDEEPGGSSELGGLFEPLKGLIGRLSRFRRLSMTFKKDVSWFENNVCFYVLFL